MSDQGPIIRKERWRADAAAAPASDDGVVPDGGSPTGSGAGDQRSDSVARSSGPPLPVLAGGGLLAGLVVSVGAYFAMTGSGKPGVSGDSAALAAGQPVVNAVPAPTVSKPVPDLTADLDITVRLWHLASLTQEEVNSLRQGLAAAGGIQGTQAAEAMQLALSAKQRELADRKTALAEQLRAIGERYQVDAVQLGDQVNRHIDKLRDDRKDASARWLELSRDWWDGMPATKPTAGYFRSKLDESL